MQEIISQNIMDYTTVPIGLRIEGQMWTGQAIESTTTCPKCGRVGVISSRQYSSAVIVHTGHANGKTLAGIDYCNLAT
jgi:hypothetical protein